MESREIAENYRISQWAEIMHERAASGETVKDFCVRKGIGKHKYYYWQQKLRKIAGRQLSKMKAQPTKATVRGFTEVMVTEPLTITEPSCHSQICIETMSCKITAGREYPLEALMAVFREIMQP